MIKKTCWHFVSLAALSLTWLANTALALKAPLRDAQQLGEAKQVTVIRVESARVLVADYPLLQRDFPELRQSSLREIDAWLIKRTSFVAENQHYLGEAVGVNEPIPAGQETAVAYRPKLYGRALVFQAGTGLIDVKGTGADAPSLGSDSNGLLSLDEAVMEFVKEKLVNTVLKHAGSTYDTIETYAVISLGFKARDKKKYDWYQAGTMLRQAHRRATENWTCLETSCALKIENQLRSYGITSVGNLRHINIQGSRATTLDPEAIVDFCSFSFSDKFAEPLNDFIPTWTHTHTLAHPDSPDFVQPNPHLLVNQKFFTDAVYADIWIEKFFAPNSAEIQHFPSFFLKSLRRSLAAQKGIWTRRKNQAAASAGSRIRSRSSDTEMQAAAQVPTPPAPLDLPELSPTGI